MFLVQVPPYSKPDSARGGRRTDASGTKPEVRGGGKGGKEGGEEGGVSRAKRECCLRGTNWGQKGERGELQKSYFLFPFPPLAVGFEFEWAGREVVKPPCRYALIREAPAVLFFVPSALHRAFELGVLARGLEASLTGSLVWLRARASARLCCCGEHRERRACRRGRRSRRSRRMAWRDAR
jgi:hypothetical protein